MFQETSSVLILVIIVCVIQYLLLVILVFYMVHQAQITQKKHELDIEEIKLKKHNEILKSKLQIQDEVLNRVSEELHDYVAQRLSLVKLRLSTITYRFSLIQESLRTSTNTIAEVMGYVRNMSHSLNSNYLISLGLVNAINQEAENLRGMGSFRLVEVKLPVEINNLPSESALMILRIIQESVNNIIKHAHADEIRIVIKRNGNCYDMSISDNGQGFTIEKVKQTGIGLQNIRERASVLGAELAIKSEPGQGSIINLKIPINAKK